MKLLAGQVSKLFDISKDTLRHYEKIGLLKPEISKENSNNKNIIQKHLIKLNKDIIIKKQKGSIINMKFWGTEDDIKNKLLTID